MAKNNIVWSFGYHHFEIQWLQFRYFHEFKIIESKIQNESDNEEEQESISQIFKQYEEKSKPNLANTEIINIGSKMKAKEINISVHLNKEQRKEKIEFLTVF